MENLFSQRLKELRTEKGFSQQALADNLSVARYYVSNLEQGRTEPDLNTLIKIAQYFEVTTDYILGLEN